MTAILLAIGSSVGYGVSDFLASRVAKRVAPVLLVLYSQALQSVGLLVVVMVVSQPYSGAGLGDGGGRGRGGWAGRLLSGPGHRADGDRGPAGLQRGRAAAAVRPGKGGAPGPGGHGRPGHGPGRDRRHLAGLRGAGRAGARPDLARPAGDPAPGRRAPPARADPARPGRGRALRALLRRRRHGRRGRRRERPLDRARGPARRPAHHPGRGAAVPGPPWFWHRRLGSAAAGGGADRAQPLRDAFLAYAVTRGDLAMVAVLASLAPVVTALLAHALTTERPSAPQAAGAALAVLGTLVVSAAQVAG